MGIKALSIITLLSWCWACNTSVDKEKTEKKQEKSSYFKTKTPAFKHIKLKTRKGRVKVKVYPYAYNAMEIRSDFNKYVQFQFEKDTLLITINSYPEGVKSGIRIYATNLKSYSSEFTETVFDKIYGNEILFKGENDSFRFAKCRIENLDIYLEGRSNAYLDSECVIENLEIHRSENSVITQNAQILKQFNYYATNLNSLTLSNMHPEQFKWHKVK